jgi:hypothetical protein
MLIQPRHHLEMDLALHSAQAETILLLVTLSPHMCPPIHGLVVVLERNTLTQPRYQLGLGMALHLVRAAAILR